MPQLTVSAYIDSHMNGKSPDTNYGSNSTVNMGILIAGGAKDQLNRAIGNFDVSAIPVGAVIQTAKMRRAITLLDPDGHAAVILRCTRPTQWTEGGVTWNKYDGATLWTIAGGDMDNATPAPVAFPEPLDVGEHDIFGLAGFVRDALDNRNGLVSVIMKNDWEAPLVPQRSHWLPRIYWKLIIDYDVPEELGRRTVICRFRGSRPTAARRPRAAAPPRTAERERRGHQPRRAGPFDSARLGRAPFRAGPSAGGGV